ncbi:non-heme iron oxygenase ferredoxin subunit [Parasphingorhabdus sp.]|uniref:non-heme iron oxygenase ferredoxin subunit n=1 Tax=Parasphingorhabdus sp. TaxID=2709688 RepID=UPI003A8D21EF
MQILCKAADVPEDEPLRVELPDGHAVAVYRWEGAFFCTDDMCSHGEASLAEGYVENGEIMCPYHMGSFCIRTGEARAAPCSVDIVAYDVVEQGDELVIDR